jgi:5-methyltetrahydropteroyltriglutamate--homocysteine methyltransferase
MANPGMYRADHIGSLLRPAELASLPADAPAAQREELADAAIKRLVTLQRELGLSIVSDGELRRTDPTSPLHDAGVGRARILDEARFLHSLLGPSTGAARVPFKVALPAPSTVPQRLAGSLRTALEALIADGVNYIQLQNTEYARCLADSAAAAPLEALLAADRAALEGLARPAEVRLALYVGRGAAARVGLFDTANAPFAEKLFSTVPVDRFVLEVDDDPSDGFAALKHVPKAKSVALGLVSTRTPKLEQRDPILDRLDQAADCMEGDFLAVCPQSGFAGSGFSEDEQRRKLELIVSISTRYWGFEA